MILDTDRKITINNDIITFGYGEKILLLDNGRKFLNGDKVMMKDVGKEVYKNLKKLGKLAK